MKKLGTLILLISLTACQDTFYATELSQLASNEMSCENFESKMFDNLHLSLDHNQKLPSVKDVTTQLRSDFKSLPNYNEHSETINNIIIKFDKFYSDLTEVFPEKLNATNVEDIKKILSQIETRDTLNKTKKDIQNQFRVQLEELQTLAKVLKQDCTEDDPVQPEPEPEVGTLFEQLEKNLSLELYGAYKTFATAYQNCEALNVKAINSSAQSAQGIAVTGRHPSGGGNKREISNLRSLQNTHPYLSQRSPASSCFSTYNSPLIYDYGGKPYSTSDSNSELNFFKNHGSGTGVLGTDCSGFIFTAMASAGLKLHPEVNLKARDVLNYGASRFKDPKNGGTSCFKKIAVAKNEVLSSGDVVASSGHIFIVSKAGADPFGINKVTSATECNKITSNDFDFEVMQSSPTNGAIGINRMVASYYLPTSSTMKAGLEKYARKACDAKFKTITEPNITEVSVVRHTKSEDCVVAKKMVLTGQDCVSQCRTSF